MPVSKKRKRKPIRKHQWGNIYSTRKLSEVEARQLEAWFLAKEAEEELADHEINLQRKGALL